MPGMHAKASKAHDRRELTASLRVAHQLWFAHGLRFVPCGVPEDGIWYPERFPGTGITFRSKNGIRNAPTSLYVKGLRIVM
jgi:hypothetical protein